MINEDIFDLIETQNIRGINILLRMNANYVRDLLHSTYTGPRTPLMAAFRMLLNADDQNQPTALQIVQILLEATAFHAPHLLAVADDDGLTPFGAALRLQNYEMCIFLIKLNVPLNSPCNGDLYPLELSARMCMPSICLRLIRLNAPYRVEMFPPESDQEILTDGNIMSLLIYRALRHSRTSTQLLTAIFFNDDHAVSQLAPLPEARYPFHSLAWDYILNNALRDGCDRACARLLPYIFNIFPLYECLAIAIYHRAPLTFGAALQYLSQHQPLAREYFPTLFQLAVTHNIPQWIDRIIEGDNNIPENSPEEDTDRFQDGQPVTDQELQNRGIRIDCISPVLGQDPTDEDLQHFTNFFPHDFVLDPDAFRPVLDYLAHYGDPASLEFFRDFQDEDEINTSGYNLLHAYVAQRNHALLRRILLLPFTPVNLSRVLPLTWQYDDPEGMLILLSDEAVTAIDENGVIIAHNTPQSLDHIRTLAVYQFLLRYINSENQNNNSLCRALIMLPYDFPLLFSTVDGPITLIELAAVDNNPALLRLMASIGLDPCPFFQKCHANPNPNLAPLLLSTIEGIRDCWVDMVNLGFHAKWLHIKAFIHPDGNRLIALLRQLANGNWLPNEVCALAAAVADILTDFIIDQPEPLYISTARLFEPLPVDIGLRPPFNTEINCQIYSYILSSYDRRDLLTQVECYNLLISVRALMRIARINANLALMILRYLRR